MIVKNKKEKKMLEELYKRMFLLPSNKKLERDILAVMSHSKEYAHAIAKEIGLDKIRDPAGEKTVFFEHFALSYIINKLIREDKDINIDVVVRELENEVGEESAKVFEEHYKNLDIERKFKNRKEDIKKLLDLYYRRRVIFRLKNYLYDITKYSLYERNQVLEDLKTTFLEILNEFNENGNNLSTSDLVDIVKEEMLSDENKVGLTTTYPFLDKYLSFNRGEIIILAGTTSIGKSAFALSLTTRKVLEFYTNNEKKVILYITIEMTPEEMIRRSIAQLSGIELYKLLGRKPKTDEDKEKISFFIDFFKELNIEFLDASMLDYNQLLFEIRYRYDLLKSQGKELALIVIDYLQQIKYPDTRHNRDWIIHQIISGFKYTAQNLKIPFLVLAQLNRNVEKREDKEPMLSDLRESGTIEQYADVVLFLYQTNEQKQMREENPKEYEVSIKIAKNRNGEKDKTDTLIFKSIYTYYQPTFDKFYEVRKQAIEKFLEKRGEKISFEIDPNKDNEMEINANMEDF